MAGSARRSDARSDATLGTARWRGGTRRLSVPKPCPSKEREASGSTAARDTLKAGVRGFHDVVTRCDELVGLQGDVSFDRLGRLLARLQIRLVDAQDLDELHALDG